MIFLCAVLQFNFVQLKVINLLKSNQEISNPAQNPASTPQNIFLNLNADWTLGLITYRCCLISLMITHYRMGKCTALVQNLVKRFHRRIQGIITSNRMFIRVEECTVQLCLHSSKRMQKSFSLSKEIHFTLLAKKVHKLIQVLGLIHLFRVQEDFL